MTFFHPYSFARAPKRDESDYQPSALKGGPGDEARSAFPGREVRDKKLPAGRKEITGKGGNEINCLQAISLTNVGPG